MLTKRTLLNLIESLPDDTVITAGTVGFDDQEIVSVNATKGRVRLSTNPSSVEQQYAAQFPKAHDPGAQLRGESLQAVDVTKVEGL